MSVWPTSVTRLGTARDIYESSEQLFTLTYGENAYPHLDPIGDYTSYDRDTRWDEIAADLNWESPEEPEGEMFLSDLRKLERVAIGSEGYFHLINVVFKGGLVFGRAPAIDDIIAMSDRALEIITPSTQVTPGAFLTKTRVRDDMADTLIHRLEDAAQGLKILKRARVWEDQDDEYENTLADRLSEKSQLLFRKVGKVYLFLGRDHATQKGVALSGKGMDMVIGALERLATALDYATRAYASQETVLNKIVDLLTYQVTRASKLRTSAADKVAKAWHEVRTYIQYEVLESIMDDAREAVAAEFESDGYSDVVDLQLACNMIRCPDVADTMELVHLYKWFPPPEYDMTRALPAVADLHLQPRTSGASRGSSTQKKEDYLKIVTERKMNLISAYKKLSGSYPDNLTMKRDHPTIDEARNWDHRDLFSYEALGKDISKQVKDKTTVKASSAQELSSTGGDIDQNYLTWYMSNWDTVDTNVWLDELDKGSLDEDEYCRAAYKGESQKVDSRPFFIAPPKRRTLLAEFEGNLSKVAKFYPAALIGKSESTTGAMMDEAMDPYASNQTVHHEVVTTTYIIMFDASKWSPKSDGEQVSEYHNFWAEVYGDKRLKRLKSIGCEDTIISTTDGLTIQYKNAGADLEGFRGRMGTMYHADMLGAVCREAVREGYIAGRSSLVVFIDDGAVKVEVKGVGEEASRNAKSFLRTLQRIYAAGGQEIHERKVAISPIGGEILANFYLHGVKVPQGIKAAMKMVPDYSNPVATLSEVNDSIFASAQGAVKAGADPFVVYAMYVSGVVKNLYRFAYRTTQDMNATTLALMMILPKSFGGLGMQSLQGLVTTGVTNLTSEGLSMLNRAGRFYPNLQVHIKKIVSRPIIVRQPLAILRDPLRVVVSGQVMIESRLVRAVLERLGQMDGTLSSFVVGDEVENTIKHAEEVARKLLEGNVISVPLTMRVWSATPLAELESLIGKFERSDSIIRTLGYREVGRIRRSNLRDVDKIVEQAKELLGNV